MHVVVSGGTGLIGQALSASLVADGHRVTILSRSPQSARVPTGVAVQGWDARSPEGWGHLVDGADAVVNLAGESLAGDGTFPARWTDQHKQRVRDSRLEAAGAVVAAVRASRRPPGVLVQASGVGYYGPLDDQPVTEEGPPASDFLGRLAVDWEGSTAPVEERGVRRVVVRTGVVLSADAGALPRMALPFRLFIGGPLGDGRQWVPWIHLQDEVGAIRFLIDHPGARGPFNLTAPEPVTNVELARSLGRVLRRPAFLLTPGFVLRAVLGEVADLVLTGQRALPAGLQALGYPFRFARLEAALADLLAR